MKRVLTLCLAMTVMASSFATATVTVPPKKAHELFVPIGKTGQKISLLDLSLITVNEFETLTGRDMKFMDKVAFKIAQRDLKKSIREDGTINNKRLLKTMNKLDGSDFSIGGFALGFLLFLLGVLIAYLISDDNRARRTKWAWIGAGTWLALVLIFALI